MPRDVDLRRIHDVSFGRNLQWDQRSHLRLRANLPRDEDVLGRIDLPRSADMPRD